MEVKLKKNNNKTYTALKSMLARTKPFSSERICNDKHLPFAVVSKKSSSDIDVIIFYTKTKIILRQKIKLLHDTCFI